VATSFLRYKRGKKRGWVHAAGKPSLSARSLAAPPRPRPRPLLGRIRATRRALGARGLARRGRALRGRTARSGTMRLPRQGLARNRAARLPLECFAYCARRLWPPFGFAQALVRLISVFGALAGALRFGGGRLTPARRASDNPMAMACLVERAPCSPCRILSISSRTNSPAWVEADLPSRLSRRAFAIARLSGMCFSNADSAADITQPVATRFATVNHEQQACRRRKPSARRQSDLPGPDRLES
jgi:hypothetical protein